MVALLDSPNLRSSPLPLATLAAVASSLPLEPGKPPYRFSVLPADEVRFALADARSVPNATAYRYVTLGHLTPEQAAQAIVAVNYTVNALSRVRAITPVTRISETVLRIDSAAYVNDDKELNEWQLAWSALAARDPYFHLRTLILAPGERLPKEVSVAGGWTGLQNESQLRAITGTPSFGAVLRSDWFVHNALNPPNYYGFTGQPATVGEWLKGLGVDQATIERLEAEAGANLFISGVTKKPRRVIWCQGPCGGVYTTLDSVLADAAHNPMYYPLSAKGFKTLAFDASELFAVAPNGMWQVFIADAQGKRLDEVDPNITTNDYVAAADGATAIKITVGRSCLLCHGGESGLNSFVDNESPLYRTVHGSVQLSSFDGSYIRRLLAFYDDPRLKRQLQFDRETHIMAVGRACGCTPQQAIAAVEEIVKHYAYDAVTAETIATENHIATKQLAEIIGQTNDKVITGVIDSERSIVRENYESIYPEIAVKVSRSRP